jgi:hypothetical protein
VYQFQGVSFPKQTFGITIFIGQNEKRVNGLRRAGMMTTGIYIPWQASSPEDVTGLKRSVRGARPQPVGDNLKLLRRK